jgi:plasmid stability protein
MAVAAASPELRAGGFVIEHPRPASNHIALEGLVAQFLVRDLEDDICEKLRELARRRGQCMEETVCDILRNAVLKRKKSSAGLGSRLAATFSDCSLEGDIRELRGHSIQPPGLKCDRPGIHLL